MRLSSFTTEQLQDEINKRSKIKEKGIPELIENPDLSILKDKCQEYLSALYTEKILNGTCKYFECFNLHMSILKELFIALYGKDINKWISE